MKRFLLLVLLLLTLSGCVSVQVSGMAGDAATKQSSTMRETDTSTTPINGAIPVAVGATPTANGTATPK